MIEPADEAPADRPRFDARASSRSSPTVLPGRPDPRRRGARDRHATAAPRSTSSILVTRIDRTRYDVSCRRALGRQRASASSSGPASRRHGHRRARRRDRGRRARGAPGRGPRRRRPQPHVPRRDRRHQGGPGPRARPVTAGRTSSRPSIRAGSARARTATLLPALTPHDGPADRGLARRSSARSPTRVASTRRSRLIYNGVDLERYDHQEPCCTLPRGVRHGARLADRRRRRPAGAGEGPPDAARGLAARAARRARTRTSSSSARAAAATRSRRRPRELRIAPPRGLHRPPRRRPGRHRRARRRRAAVLPRGPGPDRSSRRWRCRARSSRRTSAASPR